MLQSCGFNVKEDDEGCVDVATLGNFSVTTYGYYFEVEGLVPLHVALELQRHPIGYTECRVEGFCGPAEEWVPKKDVELFHIDSWAGLYVFVKTLQKHGLVELPAGFVERMF